MEVNLGAKYSVNYLKNNPAFMSKESKQTDPQDDPYRSWNEDIYTDFPTAMKRAGIAAAILAAYFGVKNCDKILEYVNQNPKEYVEIEARIKDSLERLDNVYFDQELYHSSENL